MSNRICRRQRSGDIGQGSVVACPDLLVLTAGLLPCDRAQAGLDPVEQILGRKRLRKIVVGAASEAITGRLNTRAGGQHSRYRRRRERGVGPQP